MRAWQSMVDLGAGVSRAQVGTWPRAQPVTSLRLQLQQRGGSADIYLCNSNQHPHPQIWGGVPSEL